MRFMSYAAAVAIAAAFTINTAPVTSAHAAEITGAGSTFIYPILAKWAATYQKESGLKLNYQSIGSGGGIKQIEAKTVTFGATDAPLTGPQLKKEGLIQFPMVMGGIVPVLNVPGIKAGELTIDGPTLANIFLGKITKWDDPAIKALNPGTKLPSTAIAVVHRSDASGTTFNFTNYLNKVSAGWKKSVGCAKAVEWPTGIGAKGNEGVANNVSQTKGAIGYVEYAYAKQNKLTYTKMKNKDGHIVSPTMPAFQDAAAGADWKGTPGFGVIITDQPGKGTWPITASTFILMYKKPVNLKNSKDALTFFNWAYLHGAKQAESLDYIPMPHKVVELVKAEWKEIKNSDGKPLF